MNQFGLKELQQLTAASDTTRIPDVFCWTKIGAESGQRIQDIVRRKELERRANDGVFLWGIGNSLGATLAQVQIGSPEPIEVLFSPMRSSPKLIDEQPEGLLAWLAYEMPGGYEAEVPEYSLVVSRGNVASGTPKRQHYALLCHSEASLELQSNEMIDAARARNYASCAALGASQVTALVRYNREASITAHANYYGIAFRAKLANPGFVRLRQPVVVNENIKAELVDAFAAKCDSKWVKCVRKIKVALRALAARNDPQSSLLTQSNAG